MATALPDKCSHCGLRVRMRFQDATDATEHDLAFGQLRMLYKAKIIKSQFPRRGVMNNTPGDFGDTDFCAVSSSAWGKNEKSCKYWALKIQGAGISDYLSIYHDRNNYRIAYWGVVLTVAITVVIAAIQAVA